MEREEQRMRGGREEKSKGEVEGWNERREESKDAKDIEAVFYLQHSSTLSPFRPFSPGESPPWKCTRNRYQ